MDGGRQSRGDRQDDCKGQARRGVEMTEHRRMLLSGPESGRWAPIDAETAERMLKTPYGIGGMGDQLADLGQYWEERKNGGAWTTLSYWPGAIDFWRRARLMLVERREGDERLLREKAQRLRDGAGATIEGIKNQIAAAEAARSFSSARLPG